MLTKNRFYTVGMAGFVLEAQAGGNGAAICLAQPTGEKNQEWKLVNGPDKSCCKFINAETKLVMDVEMGGTENGTRLHQWEDADVMSQEWTAQPTEDGLYKLISRASGRCMDAGLIVDAGTQLQLWDDVDGASQKWDIQEARKAAKPETEKLEEANEEAACTAKEAAEMEAPQAEEKAAAAEEEKAAVQQAVSEAAVKEPVEAPKDNFLQVTQAVVEEALEKNIPAKKPARKKSRKNKRA